MNDEGEVWGGEDTTHVLLETSNIYSFHRCWYVPERPSQAHNHIISTSSLPVPIYSHLLGQTHSIPFSVEGQIIKPPDKPAMSKENGQGKGQYPEGTSDFDGQARGFNCVAVACWRRIRT
jgi:hypothetical protein